MDIAHCALGNREYDAREFSQLPAAEREQKNEQLTCVGCGRPAHFRRASRDGRAACFTARHDEDCELASGGSIELGAGGGGHALPPRANQGNRIVLDLRVNGGQNGPDGGPGVVRRPGGRRRRFNGEGGEARNRVHRRLRPLLRRLVLVPNFRTSADIVEIPDHGDSEIRRLFVNFADLEERHFGHFHGCWGIIRNVGAMNGTVWLNTAGRYGPSVRLDEQRLPELLHAFGLPHSDHLWGQHMLLLGTVIRSQQNKPYLSLDDFRLFALWRAPAGQQQR